MARYQIIFSYDGTDFKGSQRQAVSRTVQGEIEKSLLKLGWSGKSIWVAGRTDTGTHAEGQVAAFDLEWMYGVKRLQVALNAYLPRDIAVKSVTLVDDKFSPRFDAVSRRYRYRLFTSSVRDPLRERYAWRVWPPVTGMQNFSGIWEGRYNFDLYGSSPSRGGSTIRTVLSSQWYEMGDEWTYEIEADAFLYRMVRRLVYVQVLAGQGRLTEDILLQSLDNQADVRSKLKKEIPAGLASAAGLTLMEVKY